MFKFKTPYSQLQRWRWRGAREESLRIGGCVSPCMCCACGESTSTSGSAAFLHRARTLCVNRCFAERTAPTFALCPPPCNGGHRGSRGLGQLQRVRRHGNVNISRVKSYIVLWSLITCSTYDFQDGTCCLIDTARLL